MGCVTCLCICVVSSLLTVRCVIFEQHFVLHYIMLVNTPFYARIDNNSCVCFAIECLLHNPVRFTSHYAIYTCVSLKEEIIISIN